MNLAAELTRWRLGRGLSYRGLAVRVNCEHSHLWKIERGLAVLTREMAQACDEALDAAGALVAAWVAAQGSVRPAQLPIAPLLVGGDAELVALHAGFHDRPVGMPVVAAIDGLAGVGKTALAPRWAHQIVDGCVDGQLYAEMRAFAPPGQQVTADVVLERMGVGIASTERGTVTDRYARAQMGGVARASPPQRNSPPTGGTASCPK